MKTFLKARWENLIMLNYEVSPEILQNYLPKGVELDFYEGKTFVSLVGFMFKDTKIFGLPIPFFGTFEEINLRFYVKRKVGNEVRRGVVFISEIVPNIIIAKLANLLYHEHYSAMPTSHKIEESKTQKTVEYALTNKNKKSSFKVWAKPEKLELENLEAFIYEHYFGYTKVNASKTIEYKVNHPKWKSYKVINHTINFDFKTLYGNEFAFLKNKTPNSIFLAEGSYVSVDWERTTI